MLCGRQEQGAQRRREAVRRDRSLFGQQAQGAAGFAKAFPRRHPPFQLQEQCAQRFADAVPADDLLIQKLVYLIRRYQVFGPQGLVIEHAKTDPGPWNRRQVQAAAPRQAEHFDHIAVDHLSAFVEHAAAAHGNRPDAAAQAILRLQKLAAKARRFRRRGGGKTSRPTTDDDHVDMACGFHEGSPS